VSTHILAFPWPHVAQISLQSDDGIRGSVVIFLLQHRVFLEDINDPPMEKEC